MKFVRFKAENGTGIAVAQTGEEFRGKIYRAGEGHTLIEALEAGDSEVAALALSLSEGDAIDLSSVELLPPLERFGKIVCIGLNYADHSKESGFVPPEYPTVFARFPSSLVGHRAAIVRPSVSSQLDFEGEIAVILGKGGRNISKERALNHVFGYSLFNDASIRDYQTKTPQWTIGKNFDGTGAFGPYITTAEKLPAGMKGVRLQTRLNGQLVQDASTDDLIFDVATLISTLSEAMTLAPGDVIVSGTPAGVGAARKPPLWMRPGDICEITAAGLGRLSNPITQG